MDAFTKCAVVTTITNKDAQTVSKAIFEKWFCKFGIPAQLHTHSGIELINKLISELFELLNVQHPHIICNAMLRCKSLTKQ
jgi:hypothetical protein